MPSIAVGNRPKKVNTGSLATQDYKYAYPQGLDLKPGTELHDEIATSIVARAHMSYGKISSRFDSWKEIDQTLTAYKWVDEEEREVKAQDSRKPTSIVFPFSYAIMETLVTYCFQALAQHPVFKYEGVGPEDVYGAALLELVVDLHCRKSKVPLHLHTLFRDAISYGIGIVVPTWEVRTGRKRVKETGSVHDIGGREVYSTEQINVVNNAILYEGNSLTNIDPYRFLPDTSVPSHEVQRMEFVGWTETSNLMELLQDEAYGEELFNVKYLKHVNLSLDLFGDSSDRDKAVGVPDSLYDEYINSVELITMYITLIPVEWGLGDSEIPEKWAFTVANGEVIIRAQPLDFDHGLYPIAVATPDFDGYGTLPLSRIEVLSGMQTTLDWLFNSRITNVRKSVNDMFVVDPWLVNFDDVANPEAGKLIRLRRPAWGKGVEGAITQLRVDDVTQSHIGDIGVIMNAMQRVSGVDESQQGMMREGGPERLTKAEFQGTSRAAVSRLERIANVISVQAMQDLGYFFASHTQQLMTQNMRRRVLGEWRERLGEVMQKTPEEVDINLEDLMIDYDVMVKDGSIPGGNFNEGWLTIFKMMIENPQAVQEYDANKVFEFIAMNMGAKNISDFKQRGAEIMPDDQVQQQLQAGNLEEAR